MLKDIILDMQDILEVLLEDIEIHKRESIVLHNVVPIYSLVLYVVIHYPITLSIVAFTNFDDSFSYLRHHLTPYMICLLYTSRCV